MQEQDKIPVFMSYLGFVGLLPPFVAYFLLARTPYARFHAQQGIVLMLFFLLGALPLGVARLVMLTQGMQIRIVYLLSFIWFLLYILANLLAAVFGLWGRTIKLPLLHRLVRVSED